MKKINYRSVQPGTLFRLSPDGRMFLKLKYQKCVALDELTVHNFLSKENEKVISVYIEGKFVLHPRAIHPIP